MVVYERVAEGILATAIDRSVITYVNDLNVGWGLWYIDWNGDEDCLFIPSHCDTSEYTQEHGFDKLGQTTLLFKLKETENA